MMLVNSATVFAALVVVAVSPRSSASPQATGSLRPNLSYLPPVRSKESCLCINGTQSTRNGIISGEYTYKDPLGFTVTVSYRVKTDGSDYQEERTMVGNGFTTDSVTATTTTTTTTDEEQIFTTILSQLRPTIVETIQTTTGMTSSSRPTTTFTNDILLRIITKLTPIIRRTITQILGSGRYVTPLTRQQIETIIQQVLARIRPLITELILEVFASQTVRQEPPQVDIGSVISTVIRQLRPFVQREVSRAATSWQQQFGTTELDQTTVTTQVRNMIGRNQLVEMINRVSGQSLTSNQLDEILQRLESAITQLIQEELTLYLAAHTNEIANEDEIGRIIFTVLTKLRSTIRNLITRTVDRQPQINDDALSSSVRRGISRSTLVDLMQEASQQLGTQLSTQQVETQLRLLDPRILQVILEEIARFRVENQQRTLSRQEMERVVGAALEQLTSVIEDTARRVVLQASIPFDENALANQVRGQIARNTVVNSLQDAAQAVLRLRASLSETELQQLLQLLEPRLRQAILVQVRSLAELLVDRGLSQVDVNRLIDAVVNTLRPRVVSDTRRYLASSPGAGEQTVISTISSQYQTVVPQTLERRILDEELFSTSASFSSTTWFAQMLSTITTRIRQIIQQEFRRILAEQAAIQPQQPSPGQSLNSIFGTGGGNSVRVETPRYSYGYDFRRRR